jgi:tetratricopeptide (TPR) repeat protein
MSPNNRDLQKEVRDLQATGHMAQHKMDQAQSFRDLIRDKDQAEELEKASRLEVSEADYSERVQKAMNELKEHPDDPLKVVALAKAFLDARDVARARQLLKQKYKEMQDNYDIRELLGDIQLRLYDEAIAPLEAQAEGDAEAASKLAELKEKRRQFAAREYQWRIEQHPTDANVQMSFAKSLFDDGQYNPAISIFQELTRDPRLGFEASRMLGLAFTEKNQYDLAVEQFERALMMHPAMDNQGKELRYSQAESYEKMGRPDEALAIYKKIYSQDINFRDVAEKVETLSAQATS